jgi:hypothetical protein
MGNKITMKEKVLQFVESKGTARFTDIQRFIVDTKFGEGTYDSAARTDSTWEGYKTNPYRGYYSAAFYKGHSLTPYSNRKDGYFIRGNNRLHKINNPMNPNHGKYIVVRNNELKTSL